jgi:hypothetical protein
LLLLCVGIIAWRVWPGSHPSAEALFQQGAMLMTSSDPADWDRAWSDYFEPLNRDHPRHPYEEQVSRYQQQIEDRAGLRRALAGIRRRAPLSEAERFYRRGLRLCQEGDVEEARRIWENVAVAFRGIEGEKRWVELAQEGVAELQGRLPSGEKRLEAIEAAIHRAKNLADPSEASSVRQALESLYRNDAVGQKLLSQMKR